MSRVDRKKWLEEKDNTDMYSEEPFSFFRREFDIDIVSTYKRLRNIAALPSNSLRDRMELCKAINFSAQNAYDANKVFLKARTNRELFRVEFAREMRKLNREAVVAIEDWLRTNGIKNKAITKDMVEQELSSNSNLRDRYETLLQRQEEFREIRDNCKSLAEQWSERKGLLQTQAGLLKQEREIVFGSGKIVND